MKSLLKEIRLPGLTLAGNLFLAPMAGYSDAAFRLICRQWGAFLCYTEMVSAEGVVRNNPKTLQLLKRGEEERPWGLQIFGSDPASVGRAVRALNRFAPSVYDLNCGCSVPKVLKSGAGAALLRDPKRIQAIVQAMRQETDAPVGVKLRSGWDANSLNFLETAGRAEEAGAALIGLHPRTRSQGFSGQAQLEHLSILKQHSRAALIGSGDLFSPEDALNMLTRTGCDGVMFARGALGNPFIFSETRKLLSAHDGTFPAPDGRQRLATALRHLELSVAFKGEELACRDMRKTFCHYSRGLPGGALLRSRAVRAERIEDYRRLVEDFFKDPVSRQERFEV